jgi:hypothetical protein
VGVAKADGEMKCCRAAVELLTLGLGGLALANAANGYGCSAGYRRQSVISDFTLGRAWTVYASCSHPETPRIAVMVEKNAPLAQSSAAGADSLGTVSKPPIVRMGSTVRLWLSTPVARIALSGKALENGAVGATIRVRVMPGGKVLEGTVRTADSVELIPAGFSGVGQ